VKTRNLALVCLLLAVVTSAALVAGPAPGSAAAAGAQPSSVTVPGPAPTPMPAPLAAFFATLTTPTAAPAIPGLPPGAMPATCTQAKCAQNPGPSCDQVCNCTLKAFCNFTTCTLTCHCAPPCLP
jgi:hypothetical protein